MPPRLAGLSGQAPQPRERCAKGAGLDGAGADRTTIRRAELMPQSSRTGTAATKSSRDLPEVTAFSSRFDASDRRRIGEVGAGRSHPHSRRRTESRAHQAGSLARVPPRPSLAGDLYRRLRVGTAGARIKSGATPARFMPMLRNAATGIPAHRSTWRAARPRVCVPAPPAPCGSRRAARAARPKL